MRILIAFVGVLISGICFGQEQDTLRLNKKVNAVQQKVKVATDTILNNPQDSALQRAERIDSIRHAAQSEVDSLNKKINSITERANQLQSLGSLGSTSDTLVQLPRGDTLQQKITGTIEQAENGLNEVQDGLNSKVDSVRTRVQEKISRAGEKVENKLNKRTSKKIDVPEGDVSLPELPDVSMPGAEGIPDTGLKLPGVDVPSVDTSLPGVQLDKLPELNTDVKILSDSGRLNTGAIKDIPGVEKVKGLSEVQKIQEQAGKVKEAKFEEMDTELVEDKVTELAGVEEVDAQTQKMKALQAQQEALLQRYKDKKLLQDEIVRKSGNVKNDIINKNAQAFKDAQAQIAKTRKLNSSVNSVKAMKKQRVNQMKGLNFQTYGGEYIRLDLGLQVGYKLTGRWSLGAGGVHRFGFSKDFERFVQSEHIYGYRSFANFKAIKSLYLQAEYEWLHYPAMLTSLENSRSEVKGMVLGLEKRFNLSRRWTGSIIGLYRLQSQNHLPGVNKFSVRMGLNLNTKKLR
jgi:hypothetical protein